MKPETGKVRCDICEWHGRHDELLKAANPFDLSWIYGCPYCKSIDNFSVICDEPGCRKRQSCGWSSRYGYRQTCGEHAGGIHTKKATP